MSFFRELKASSMNNERCLVDTLSHMGYSPVVESNQTVRGDTAADARKGYDVVLKKEATGYGGDIGFKLEDNAYVLGMDPYVVRGFTPQSFLKQVEGEYVVTRAKDTAKKLGLRLTGTKNVKVNGKQVTRLQYEKVGA